MYSVIVPTMWRGKEFAEMLPLIDAHPLVGEVLVIDNAKDKRPEWLLRCEWSDKIKILKQERNIFVNPAWNLGVSVAAHDQLCFLSDDVRFDVAVFDVLKDHLGPKDGAIGPNGNCFIENHAGYEHDTGKPSHVPDVDYTQSIQLENYGKEDYMDCGWGVVLFLNKANYIPIPQQFRIFFGDVWIFETHRHTLGLLPRKFKNFDIYSEFGTTSGYFGGGMEAEKGFIWRLFQYTNFRPGFKGEAK